MKHSSLYSSSISIGLRLLYGRRAAYSRTRRCAACTRRRRAVQRLWTYTFTTAGGTSDKLQDLARVRCHVPARHVPARHVPARHVPARHVPARHVPARHVPARHVPARHVPARHVPARRVPGHLAIFDVLIAV